MVQAACPRETPAAPPPPQAPGAYHLPSMSVDWTTPKTLCMWTRTGCAFLGPVYFTECHTVRVHGCSQGSWQGSESPSLLRLSSTLFHVRSASCSPVHRPWVASPSWLRLPLPEHGCADLSSPPCFQSLQVFLPRNGVTRLSGNSLVVFGGPSGLSSTATAPASVPSSRARGARRAAPSAALVGGFCREHPHACLSDPL